MAELERQAFHFCMGLMAIALVVSLGTLYAAYITSSILIFGLLLMHLKMRGMKLGPFEHFIGRFERSGVVEGYGAATFTAASLAIMTLLPSQSQVLSSLVILGFGDAASTAVGIHGKTKLGHNKRKTLEGSIAFFVASLPAALFAGAPAILVAALASAAESLESKMDDNLIIAVVCVIAFRLFGA
jgi:dolichol kinase